LHLGVEAQRLVSYLVVVVELNMDYHLI